MLPKLSVNSPLIVALDYAHASEALALVDQLDPADCRVKVGKELFTRVGPRIISELHERKFEVFLDLKFHDIPNTVAKAVLAAAEMGVWMLDVHASGGSRMMNAAKNILEQNGFNAVKVIGISVLTSMSSDELLELGIESNAEQQVLRLATLAHKAGLDGMVCSALEASAIRDALGDSLELVCPGIRPRGAVSADDQQRVMTPRDAVQNGANYIVVGRPITLAPNPSEAVSLILHDLAEADA